MIPEEKQLLLKDLCAKLPYSVIVDNPNPAGGAWDEVINVDVSAKTVTLLYDGRVFSIDDVKPYLRPMSSMTKEERNEWISLMRKEYREQYPYSAIDTSYYEYFPTIESFDYLNSNHFDYRGLIEKSLALIAPEEMYK